MHARAEGVWRAGGLGTTMLTLALTRWQTQFVYQYFLTCPKRACITYALKNSMKLKQACWRTKGYVSTNGIINACGLFHYPNGILLWFVPYLHTK